MARLNLNQALSGMPNKVDTSGEMSVNVNAPSGTTVRETPAARCFGGSACKEMFKCRIQIRRHRSKGRMVTLIPIALISNKTRVIDEHVGKYRAMLRAGQQLAPIRVRRWGAGLRLP